MTETLKQPPHSAELERAVLGAVMLDAAAMDKIADRLAPEDFYLAGHQLIFGACLELYAKSQAIDPVSVVERLKASGSLDNAGGLDSVTAILDDARGSANVWHYANQMRDKSLERQLLSASYRVSDYVYDDIPTMEKVQRAQQSVMEIGEASDKSALVEMDTLLSESLEEIDYRASLGGGLIGLSTGFEKLDEMTSGLEPGTMIVIAGRPSMGKSTVAMNIVERQLLQDKFCVVFNLEMPRKSIMLRTYSSLSGIHHDKIRKGHLSGEDYPRLNDAVAKLKGRPLMIDDTAGITTAQMRARLRRASRKRPIDLIVVDYLQIMGDRVDGNDTSRITYISRQLKALAKEFNCPLVALSQLNRGVEERQNKRPKMSDLRDSGAIEQDSDVILMMYRDEYYNEDSQYKGIAECIIGKQRNGPTGHIYLRSELEFMRFTDFTGEVPTYQPKGKPFASIYNNGRAA